MSWCYAPRASDGPTTRSNRRLLRADRTARQRRHGGCVSRPRFASRPDGRDQVRLAASLRQAGRRGQAGSRSAPGVVAQPPRHRLGVRRRPSRGPALCGDGADRGPDAGGPDLRRPAADSRGGRDRHAGGRRARRRARRRRGPSRSEAAEHHADCGRPAQGGRLRPQQGRLRTGKWQQRDDRRRDVDRPLRGDGHRGVHGAGAGPVAPRRCAYRSVRAGRDPVRNAHRPPRVSPRLGGADDVGDPGR